MELGRGREIVDGGGRKSDGRGRESGGDFEAEGWKLEVRKLPLRPLNPVSGRQFFKPELQTLLAGWADSNPKPRTSSFKLQASNIQLQLIYYTQPFYMGVTPIKNPCWLKNTVASFQRSGFCLLFAGC